METRRDFIKKTLRIGTFVAITSTSAYLILNRDGSESCESEFTCSNCKKDKCGIRKEEFSTKDKKLR
jgi:hypothetical protein